MTPGESGQGWPTGGEEAPAPGPVPATPAPEGNNGDCVSATDLLIQLARCQRGIRDLLRTAGARIAPMASQTLPAVAFTLSGLIHANEMTANKVLDHAEGLAGDRDRLGKALAGLEPLVAGGTPAARRAWLDVMECNQALAGRVMSIMSAMAFQDLTTQHLTSAIASVEQVRELLLQILALLDLPVETEEGSRRSMAPPNPRQALAEELWAEMTEH